jgi:hypothetical protein
MSRRSSKALRAEISFPHIGAEIAMDDVYGNAGLSSALNGAEFQRDVSARVRHENRI